MAFSLEEIRNILGNDFVCEVRGQNGNVKCDFARMVNKNAKGFSGDEKVTLLYEARTRLKAAGYSNVTCALQVRNQNGDWTAWPHIWVNRAQQEQADVRASVESNAKAIAEMGQNMNKILALLSADRATPITTDADGDGVVEEPSEDTPDEAAY